MGLYQHPGLQSRVHLHIYSPSNEITSLGLPWASSAQLSSLLLGHRITEELSLEETFKGHLPQPPLSNCPCLYFGIKAALDTWHVCTRVFEILQVFYCCGSTGGVSNDIPDARHCILSVFIHLHSKIHELQWFSYKRESSCAVWNPYSGV